MSLAVDLDEHFAEVPAPVTKAAHPIHPLAPDVCGKQWPELVPPQPYRLVSWQMSIPRSNSKSSTLRSDSGNRTDIITINQITSGDELK